MALTAYEIIKRSSPSLAKHFKETEEMINEISKEINKVKPVSDLCYFGSNSTPVRDYGYDYLIIAEHVDGKPTGNSVVVAIDSPGYKGGTSWINAKRDYTTEPRIFVNYSDDYEASQSIFYLIKWSDIDIYLVNMLKTVVGLAEKTNDEIIVEANKNGVINVTNQQVDSGAILKYQYDGIYHYIELRDHYSQSDTGQYSKNYTLDDDHYLQIISSTATYTQLTCKVVYKKPIHDINLLNIGIVKLGEDYNYEISNGQLLAKQHIVRFGLEDDDNIYIYFIPLTEITCNNANVCIHAYGKRVDNDYQINVSKTATDNVYTFCVTSVTK
ncbi:MAG TPA: hypothetical protein DDW20_02680 [Firmicutes bacterium]|nr:hypothetical protein [Bacillota bacterium]